MMTGPADSMLSAQSFQALHAPEKLPHTANGGNLAQLRKVAKDFEAVYLSQMLQPLFQNLGAEAPFGGGHGEDVWRSMQVQELAGNEGVGCIGLHVTCLWSDE